MHQHDDPREIQFGIDIARELKDRNKPREGQHSNQQETQRGCSVGIRGQSSWLRAYLGLFWKTITAGNNDGVPFLHT